MLVYYQQNKTGTKLTYMLELNFKKKKKKRYSIEYHKKVTALTIT